MNQTGMSTTMWCSAIKRVLAACAIVAGTLAACLVYQAPLNARENGTVGTDARINVEGDRIRLTMVLSAPVEVDAYVLAGPDRIVVDLPEVNFQVPATLGRKATGFVSGFRFGLIAPGRSRIVIDLAEPASVVARVTPVRGGFGELSIELRKTDKNEFQASIRKPDAISRSAKTVLPAPFELEFTEPNRHSASAADRKPVIMIDPGHGGIDPGASNATVNEKAIVLAFGLTLREILEQGGRYTVSMTRADDRFVSLGERVRMARAAGADLFISVHADSISQAGNVRGATIYTGSDRATDSESAKLAAKENAVDAAAGLEASETAEEVTGILMELARRETKMFSSAFAKGLVGKLEPTVKLHRVPLRSAGFRVLGAPDIPSVLIELGYISSAHDVELLTSESWRKGAVQSVSTAIDDFFRNRRSTLQGATVSP